MKKLALVGLMSALLVGNALAQAGGGGGIGTGGTAATGSATQDPKTTSAPGSKQPMANDKDAMKNGGPNSSNPPAASAPMNQSK